MSDALILARQFRAALLRRDAASQAEILRAYETVWEKLTAEIERLAAALEAGGNRPSLLFEHSRLQQLQDQLAEEISQVAKHAGAVTLSEQARVVELARSHSFRLMQAAAGDRSLRLRARFASLANDELQHLVGVMRDGSPVVQAFKKLGAQIGLDSAEPVKKALLEGMALGSNPKRIAAAVRHEVDANFTPGRVTRSDPRAVRVLNLGVREQVLGAYREATRLNYERNDKLLSGWVWTSTRSATTCVICWAMDGTIFPAGESLVSHVSCRCVARPLLPGQSAGEPGESAFSKLERGVQKEILGDLGFEAYDSGMVELGDFVGIRNDQRWGASRIRIGLEEILGKAKLEKLRLKAQN